MHRMRGIMKPLATAVSFILLFMVMCAWAESPQVDFSGTWIQDMDQSDAHPKFMRSLGAPNDIMPGGMGGMGGMGGFGGGMGGPMPGGQNAKQPAANTPPPPMVIKHSGKEIQIITTMNMGGKEMPIIENYTLDGKDTVQETAVPNSQEKSERKTKAKQKKNKITISTKTTTTSTQNEVKKEFSLSKDGKVLTLKISNQTVTNGMSSRSTVQKIVYNKQ